MLPMPWVARSAPGHQRTAWPSPQNIPRSSQLTLGLCRVTFKQFFEVSFAYHKFSLLDMHNQ